MFIWDGPKRSRVASASTSETRARELSSCSPQDSNYFLHTAHSHDNSHCTFLSWSGISAREHLSSRGCLLQHQDAMAVCVLGSMCIHVVCEQCLLWNCIRGASMRYPVAMDRQSRARVPFLALRKNWRRL